MNIVTGETLWTQLNKIKEQYPYLSHNIETDVVIVGGGITGALCAYYFTMAGIKTVLVDKNLIGYGSTSASTSILQYEIDVDLIGLRGLIGEKNAVACFNATKQAVFDIDNLIKALDDTCGFSMRDCLYYSNKPNDVAFLRKEYALRKKHGFDVAFIDKDEAKDKFTFNVEAGIYSNGLAGEIDPYRFTHALIRKAISKGLKVYENTEVFKIEDKDGHVLLTTHNDFKIKANKLIMATGFDAKKYFKKKTAIMTRSFTVVTKPVKNFDGWHKRCIIRDTKNAYTYMRTTSDGRIIIGGEDEGLGGLRSKMTNLTHEDPFSQHKYALLEKQLKSYFPNIKDIEIEYGFSGFFGESKDGLPYIGEHPDYPNHYFCLGYGSNGILYALLGSQLLRDLHLGKTSALLDLFRMDR